MGTKQVIGFVSGAALAILAAPSLLMLFPGLVGASQADVVLTGSMEPAIHAGDLVVLDQAPAPDRLAVGTIIAYRAADGTTIVLHRIIQIQDQGGRVAYVTRGDANPTPDPDTVEADQVVGTYSFRVPYYGYLLKLGAGRLGLIALVILPSIFLIIHEAKVLARGGTKAPAPKAAAGVKAQRAPGVRP